MRTELNALTLLRRNIESLLYGRKESQASLAWALGHDKSWLNKFLKGDREIQLKDLDRIADFFGIATYQLFQPGISPLTERRNGPDRRSGKDRRISHDTRIARELEAQLHPQQRKGPDHHGGATANAADGALRTLIADFERRVARLLSQADAGRQTPSTRYARLPKASRHRTAGGSDAPGD